MVKSKKKLVLIIGFIFSIFVFCLGWLSWSNVKAKADEAEEPKHVSLVEFQFFNAYSEDSQNVAAVMGKYGMLLRFDDILSDTVSEVNGGIKTVNLIDKYGDYVFLNDIPLKEIADAEICYYFENYMWVHVPFMDNYRKFSVNESFVFEDRTIEPFAIYTAYVTYENATYNYFTADGQEYLNTKTQELEYKEIVFNNIGYKYFAPKNGLLLAYDKKNSENGEWMNANISASPTEKDGGIQKINLLNHEATKNSLLGDGKSVGENVFLDGIPFKDIPGAEIHYHSERFVWFYVPDMIRYQKFEIKDNTLFLDSYLQGKVLYSNGNEWVEYDPNAPREEMESVSYVGLEWNNYDFGFKGGKNGLLMSFSDNLSKMRKEVEGSVRSVNKVTSSIGEHVRLNGTPLKEIAGAEISYHSEGHLWVYIPTEYLTISGGNFPCLTIEEGTEFLNAILPEVTLYFDGSYWQENDPSTFEYAQNAFAEIMHNHHTIEGNEGYAYTVLSFVDDFAVLESARPNLAKAGVASYAISLNGVSLSALYAEDNNTDCEVRDEYGVNTMLLVYRKADLHPTAQYPVPTLKIESGTKFFDKTIGEITLYLVDGEWSETSAPSTGVVEDTNAPHIYYYGESEYLLFTGDDADSFVWNAAAFDEVDGYVAYSIEIPEEAISEGKWNHGKWEVKIVASDAQNNQSEKTISVTVIDREQEFLSIYVNGKFSYRVRYGDKIEHGKDDALANGAPEKADSATSYFVFAGWTFNGRLWDFENDVVTEDVWLSPMYREYKRLFSVTIVGENNEDLAFLTAKYGEVIDFSEYEKEGYVVYAQVDGVILNSITVKGNTTVQLHYAPLTQESAPASSSSSSSQFVILAICWLGSAALIAVSVVLYKKLGKKAGDK